MARIELVKNESDPIFSVKISIFTIDHMIVLYLYHGFIEM